MNTRQFILSLFLVLAVSPSVAVGESAKAAAEAVPPVVAPGAPLPGPSVLPKKAVAYYVEDVQSDTPLLSYNADKRIEPASLTKLMTAYLTFEALKSGEIKGDQMVEVSEKAKRTEGSRMFVDPRVPVSVDDLVKGMIVQSGNDACVVLAEAIAGGEPAFVEMMNRKAVQLGLKDSHFENATGLPGDDHYTTVRDLAVLTKAIMRDFPEFYPIYSMKEFTYNNIRQKNRNDLLFRDANVDGVKTGHTRSAGYNLVASTHRNGRRVLSVLVGSDGSERRAADSGKLLNWGVDEFVAKRLFEGGKPISRAKIYKGRSGELPVGFPRDMYLTLPAAMRGAEVSVRLKYKEPILAPVREGDPVGKTEIVVNDRVYAVKDAVALTTVEEAGIWTRAWDGVVLWVKSFF